MAALYFLSVDAVALSAATAKSVLELGTTSAVRARIVEWWVDFDGVTDVGHRFTDELFRVFAKANPQIELVATNTTPRIEALIKSARAG
jgi:anti-anti-sigma regulatory factor